ncbi:MAG: MFS transporter [Anaerolineales bacterium]|jgi:MFS family permease
MKPKSNNLLNAELVIFLIGISFSEASRSMTMVQIPIHLRELGADIQQVGFFFSSVLVFSLVLRVFGGWLSDSIGRLRAITLGSLAGILGYLPYAFATTWQMALLGPALLAISTALIAPSYAAYIADNAPKDKRARAFGVAEAIRTIAWIVGPPLGGFLAETVNARALFLAASLSFSMAAFIFWGLRRRLPPETRQSEQPTNWPTLKKSLLEMFALLVSGGLVTWILITDGTFDIGIKLSRDLMPVYLAEIGGLSKTAIGQLDGINGLAWAAGSLMAGWYIERTSQRAGVATGLILLACSQVMFALTLSPLGFGVSWALMGLGGSVLDPALNSLVAEGVPSRLRGMTYGLLATSLGLISLPFPWLGAQIWTWIGPKAPFLLTAILAVLAITPAWLKLIPPKTHPDDAPSGSLLVPADDD